MSDKFGDRMKMYEHSSTSRRAFKGQPLIARLDGKAFHTFTKGLKRPYDERLSTLMEKTMIYLVDQLQATVGYTQSDEIMLAWISSSAPTAPDLPYGGRFQKIESLSAGMATAYFNKHLNTFLPMKAHLLPVFDSRAFVVPNEAEAVNEFIWRQQDATKNAISMAAQSMFPHGELQNKNGAEMQEMMFTQHRVNFNDYPPFFKRGTFARRMKIVRHSLSAEELAKIPVEYHPTAPIIRSEVRTFDMWITKQVNPVECLLHGMTPNAQVADNS